MKNLNLPESEIQGTPLSPEEQKIIVVVGDPTYSCRCSYTLNEETAGSDNKKPEHHISWAPNKVEDCAAECASSCAGHDGKTCEQFNWAYTISYSGNGKG